MKIQSKLRLKQLVDMKFEANKENMRNRLTPLAFQNPCPIIVHSVAKYRPHVSHFGENVIFAIPT